MEYREEQSEFVKSYAVMQFNKQFKLNKYDELNASFSNIKTIKEFYRPQRFYRRKNTLFGSNESKIQITLLEYGQRGSFLLLTSPLTISQNIEDQRKEEVCYKSIYYKWHVFNKTNYCFYWL